MIFETLTVAMGEALLTTLKAMAMVSCPMFRWPRIRRVSLWVVES